MDHKPLLGLFKGGREISPTGGARVQHWALVLVNYYFQLLYKPFSKFSNEEGLSRLHVEDYFNTLVILSMSVLYSHMQIHAERIITTR